jgi:nitrate/nitrite transport system permease protein
MLNNAINFCNRSGLTWFVPWLRLAAGEDPREQLRAMWMMMGVPFIAIAVFLTVWNAGAAGVQTSLGAIPSPAQVWEAAKGLVADHAAERQKAVEFYSKQDAKNAALLAADPQARIKERRWTGKATYLDQIATSLKTVFAGFVLASLVAVPLGLLCGLSPTVQAALNPLIQIFRPVSPLAWLPIVTLCVAALYTQENEWLKKSFLTSAITVTLCSLWPTLINTAVGVASLDKDLLNVSKMLRLSWYSKVFRIVLPSSMPYIFTGLRLSLGVGWMVLIAAEMLAQNPGLGKFVWDEFQNGSSESLGRIMVAVLTIGIIGFLLDRVMLTLQQIFSYQEDGL